MKQEAVGSTEHFHSSCGKGFGQERAHNLILSFLKVNPFAMQSSLVLRDGSFEVVGRVRHMHIQPI